MDDLGEGKVYSELRDLLDNLDACLAEIRTKIDELTIARGLHCDES